MAAQPKDAFIPSLTPEQWAGLARLGDLARATERLMEGPADALPMTIARRVGQWNEHFEWEAGIGELLETIRVLHEAGVLRRVRENAAFVSETLQLLAPLAPKMLEALQAIPIAEWVAAAQGLGSLLSRVEDVLNFFKGPAGSALVAKLEELGGLWEETAADTTVRTTLRALKQLREDGDLQRLADIGRQIGLLAGSTDMESWIGPFIKQVGDGSTLTSVVQMARSGKAMAQAFAEAIEHEPQEQMGGLSGLYHMLKDPDVQRGLRVAAVLPTYLEKAGLLPRTGK